MFNYREGSSWPKPIFPFGEYFANNTNVIWAWFNVDSSWSEEMTFRAKLEKPGSGNIQLKVIGIIDSQGNYDEVTDTISITSKKSLSFVFSQIFMWKWLIRNWFV